MTVDATARVGEVFQVSTVLEFDDGSSEGQIMHEGDEASCEKMSDLISAISYSGDRKVVGSRLVTIPKSVTGIEVGQRWRMEPEKS